MQPIELDDLGDGAGGIRLGPGANSGVIGEATESEDVQDLAHGGLVPGVAVDGGQPGQRDIRSGDATGPTSPTGTASAAGAAGAPRAARFI